MSNNINNDDYNLYILAELNYKEHHQGELNIFPADWYSIEDYKYKTKIIAEALMNNTSIENTPLYQNRYNTGNFIK